MQQFKKRIFSKLYIKKQNNFSYVKYTNYDDFIHGDPCHMPKVNL